MRGCTVLAVTWLILLAGIAVAPPTAAHDLGVARVTLHELAPGEFRVVAKLPQNVTADAPVFPPRCNVGPVRSKALPANNRSDSWEVHCRGEAAAGEILIFPWRREGIALRAAWRDGSQRSLFLPAGADGGEVLLDDLRTRPGSWFDDASHFLALGVEHILLGWDHLAFVLALCLVAGGRELVKLITLFTLGHSLTLALATWEWVSLPLLPVEVCIALSVAFVAREALRPASPRPGHGAAMVLAFGLLHGLGFASALAESGIHGGDRLLGLLMFNLGVEAGQLLFVLVVVTAAWLARPWATTGGMRQPVGFALGSLAMFWTLDRLALMIV